MPNPLDALRNARSIGADPHPPPHPDDDWLGTVVQGLLGTMGLGDSNSKANLGGQLLGAAVPFAGGMRAPLRDLISGEVPNALDEVGMRLVSGPNSIPYPKTGHAPTDALVNLLSQPPEPKNPMQVFAGEKIGGLAPPRPSYTAPAGWTVDGDNIQGQYWPSRQPGLQALRDQQMAQRARFVPPPLQISAVKAPEDLQFITPQRAAISHPPPPLSGKWGGQRRGLNK